MFKYPLKKRKKSLLSGLCLITVMYAGFHFIYLRDEYSPLRLLSNIESEASRLIKFMGQVQLQCNSSIATNNASTWMLCLDDEIGLSKWNDEDYKDGVVYSIG